MKRFTGDNYTRYSTPDLETLAEAAYQAAKGRKPAYFVPSWADDELVFAFNRDRLPVNLEYWGAPPYASIMDNRQLQSGRNTAPYRIEVKGPWYTSPKPKGNRAYEAEDRGKLRVLSPKGLDDMLTPLEALAAAAPGTRFMPHAAEAQLLYVLLCRAGVQVCNRRRTMVGSRPKLLSFCRVYVTEHATQHVRIERNVQTKREKSLPAEVLRRLLDTYLTGGAHNGMRWKRWTINAKAEEYYDFWVKSEEQRQRVLAKGGQVGEDQLHTSPGDMLRELAEEYDKRCEEQLAQEQKG